MIQDKPEYGKLYSLTGGLNTPCIMNGNTWAESEVVCCVKCKNVLTVPAHKITNKKPLCEQCWLQLKGEQHVRS